MIDDQVPETKENLPPGSLGSGIGVFVHRRDRTRATRRLSRDVSSRPAMGNQPGVARMDTSDPDGTPSVIRRKSSEAARQQRTPAGCGPLSTIEYQENLHEVRAVLTDIINRVDCEPSSEAGAETSGDYEEDMANRTFTTRSLAAQLKDLPCVPEATADHAGEKPPTSVDDEAEHALPEALAVQLKDLTCVTEATADHAGEKPPTSVDDKAEHALPEGHAITPGGPWSSWDTWPQSSSAFLGDDTNKSELDLTFTTAKGSPLGATGYFNISGNDASAPAPVVRRKVNTPAVSTLDESHHQPDSLQEVLESTLELPSVPSEHSSRDATFFAGGDTLLLPESRNASTKPCGSLSPGVINETVAPFELYDQNVNLLEPSDLQKLPDAPVLQDTDLLPHIGNSSSPSALTGSNEDKKTSDADSKAKDSSGTYGQDGALTFGITDSNDNVVTSPGEASAAGTGVIPKSSGGAAVGSSAECSADKDKTEGTLPVDSEAGPEVAQFSEEEFKAAADHYKEDFEFLVKVGSSRRLGRTSLGRCTLYLFDPLCRRSSDASEDLTAKCKASPALSNKSDLTNLNKSTGSDLLEFSSPVKGSYSPEQMFSEKEMSQALKYQELMFQERLLKKDQECVRQLESVRQEMESYRSKLEDSQKFFKMQEKALQSLSRDNENMLEAMRSFTKDAEEKFAEQEDDMQKVVKERDQLAEDLQNMEMTFADFHRRYEKAKQVMSVMKENEALLKRQLAEANEALEKKCRMVHAIKTKTEESIEGAHKEVENTKRTFEADITVLKGQLKKACMTINSLEKRLEQKNEENTELTKLYDDLLNQVKAK
ncbi:hypothetical protein MRX96_007047 [Rhipicephalus microplus]